MIACTAMFIFTLVFATVEAEKDAVRSQILNNVEAGLRSRGEGAILADR